MDETTFLHTILKGASEPLANYIRRKPAAQDLIRSAWGQIAPKKTRKVALAAWDKWGKEYEALPNAEKYPLTDAIMNQELPPGVVWVDEEKQEIVEGERLPFPLQYGVVYQGNLVRVGEQPDKKVSAYFRISPQVYPTYARRPGEPKYRASFSTEAYARDGTQIRSPGRADLASVAQTAKIYGDGSSFPDAVKPSGPIKAKVLFGGGAPYRKAVKAVLVAGAPGIRWRTRGGRGTVAGTSYFTGEGGTPAQRKVAAELLQEMLNQGSERSLSADDFTFYDEMTGARRGTDSATIPERFLDVAMAAAPTRAQRADARKKKAPEVRADRDSGYRIKFSDIPAGAIVVKERKSRYGGTSINLYRRVAGSSRMPAVAMVAKQQATAYGDKTKSFAVPGFTRARIFGTARVPVQAWALVTKLLKDAEIPAGPTLRVILETRGGYSDVSHLRGSTAQKSVTGITDAEVMDSTALITFFANTKPGDRIDLVMVRPKGARAEIRDAKITQVKESYQISYGDQEIETSRGAVRNVRFDKRSWTVYGPGWKTLGRVIRVTPAEKKTRAKKASTPRAKKASVQVTGEGEFRYAKRSGDWLNIGVTVDDKKLRFGWSAVDKRWARKLVPPAWAVEAAIAAQPEEADEWQLALEAIGRKSNPRKSAAQQDREWNRLSLALERQWDAGTLRANPERSVRPSKHHPNMQSVLFDRARWTPSSARRWLAKNDYESDSYRFDLVGDGEFFRVRQADPDSFDRLRTITLSDRKGIKAIVGYSGKRKKNGPGREVTIEADRINPDTYVVYLHGYRRQVALTPPVPLEQAREIASIARNYPKNYTPEQIGSEIYRAFFS